MKKSKDLFILTWTMADKCLGGLNGTILKEIPFFSQGVFLVDIFSENTNYKPTLLWIK